MGSYTPDADGHTVTISYSSSGIGRDSTGFYFYPTSLGLKYVVLTLNDGYDYTTYTIYVDIVATLNSPPVYNSPLSSYTPLSVPLNSIGSLPVPSFHDPDSTPGCCTVSIRFYSRVTATVNVNAYYSSVPSGLFVAPVGFG